MHIVTVRFTLRPDALDAFLTAVRRQRDASLQHSAGCRRFEIAHDGARAVFLYEAYDAPADFSAHLQTGHFRAFAAETADMVLEKLVEQWQADPQSGQRPEGSPQD
jgi:quinol monooxygenase YgiN